MTRDTEFDLANGTILLTPNSDAYASELSVSRIDDSNIAATWIERSAEVSICWRMIRAGKLGPIEKMPPVAGAPAQPKICGPLLIWNEFEDANGSLWHLEVDAHQKAQPKPIENLGGVNCGAFACSCTPDGRVWLMVESWESDSVGMHLLNWERGVWHLHTKVEGDRTRARPALWSSNNGILASFDEWFDVHSVVQTQILGEDSVSLPTPEGNSESLSSVCVDGEGTQFVARCRDRLVHLHDGIAGYHSELVVSARLGSKHWRDVATVNIDHGMNPWLAPYCGRRRQPYLVPRNNGAWLLWEEKEDVKSMDPPWGRLCAIAMDSEGQKSDPLIALDKVSMVVLEEHAEGDSLLVAARTRESAWQNRIPYSLQQVRLDQVTQERPKDLESNASCQTFELRKPPQRRPELNTGDLKLFFGDPHIHSWWSQDLDGEQDELYLLGRDISKLDFIAFTENDFHWYAAETLSEAMWQRNRRNANFFNDPGKFTALLGWEFTKCGNPNLGDKHTSHRCVLYAGETGEVDCWYESETNSPAALADKLNGERVLLHHHHPGPFDLTNDSLERNIEIFSGWWNCMEKPEFVTKLHDLLGRGFRVGFFGGSDNHVRTPGIGGALTGAWATENTREGIFDAFWNRRVFATTGLRPDLRFTVSDCFMGSEVIVNESPQVSLYVQCDSPIQKVEILRDGEVVNSVEVGEPELQFDWTDNSCLPGNHYYYAHVVFEGHESNPYWNIASAYGIHAWSSPVWVQYQ